MADNKSKRRGLDPKLFHKNESYEVRYAVEQLGKEFTNKKPAQIKKALLDSARVKNFHENRKMIMNSARMKLAN